MRKCFLILLFLPAIIFAQKKDYKTYDKAVYYFNNGEIEKAKNTVAKCIRKGSDWEKPYQLLGKIHESEGNLELAVEYYYKGFDQNNSNDQLWFKKIGDLYFENGEYTEALYHYKSFVAFADREEKVYRKSIKHIQDCMYAINAIENPVEFNPKNMGKYINSAKAEYLPFISADGKKFVFTRKVEGKFDLQEDFFVSYWENAWTDAKTMHSINTPFNEGAIAITADEGMLVYTACNRKGGKGSCDLYLKLNGKEQVVNLKNVNSKDWDTQGCFSPDGKFLYFVSNRPGGYGGKDIWISEISDNVFGKPYNAGSAINTVYNEMSPFLHADNLTFYFASDGHIGMGDFDLFVSKRESSEQDWADPENMGYPINTHKVENSLIVATDGKTAYYVSDNSGFGAEDIFYFNLPETKQANPISALELDIITKSAGEEVILKNVHFAHNSFELTSDSSKELDRLIAYLRRNPHLQIEIQGHTDDVGEQEKNQILSEKRAEAVFIYLRENKIISDRLIYKGFGESKPLVANDSEKGRSINRRTSFRVIQ
ncbi:MAG: OmpA family protein [Bacteroidota bacterium]|nr:OmpA family protein [Bacteroidota bacterium]